MAETALEDYDGLIFSVSVAASVSIPVVIKKAVTKPVAASIATTRRCGRSAQGWTLCARNDLCTQPARLSLIGARFTYLVQLNGYCLPEGLCICEASPCRCQGIQLTPGDEPGALVLVGARRRNRGIAPTRTLPTIPATTRRSTVAPVR